MDSYRKYLSEQILAEDKVVCFLVHMKRGGTDTEADYISHTEPSTEGSCQYSQAVSDPLSAARFF